MSHFVLGILVGAAGLATLVYGATVFAESVEAQTQQHPGPDEYELWPANR